MGAPRDDNRYHCSRIITEAILGLSLSSQFVFIEGNTAVVRLPYFGGADPAKINLGP